MKTMTPHASAPATELATPPWWRNPWLWLVMIGPAVVVVAGFATWAIAWHGADKLVSADYYQKGLALPKESSAAGQAPMLPAGQARNHAATGGTPKPIDLPVKSSAP